MFLLILCSLLFPLFLLIFVAFILSLLSLFIWHLFLFFPLSALVKRHVLIILCSLSFPFFISRIYPFSFVSLYLTSFFYIFSVEHLSEERHALVFLCSLLFPCFCCIYPFSFVSFYLILFNIFPLSTLMKRQTCIVIGILSWLCLHYILCYILRVLFIHFLPTINWHETLLFIFLSDLETEAHPYFPCFPRMKIQKTILFLILRYTERNVIIASLFLYLSLNNPQSAVVFPCSLLL